MSYARGEYHIWADDYRINFKMDDVCVSIPNTIMDEYVMMRHAELTTSHIKRIEKRTLKKHLGNFGCDGLARKYGKPSVMQTIEKKYNIKKYSKQK